MQGRAFATSHDDGRRRVHVAQTVQQHVHGFFLLLDLQLRELGHYQRTYNLDLVDGQEATRASVSIIVFRAIQEHFCQQCCTQQI